MARRMWFKSFSQAHEWGCSHGCGVVRLSENGEGFEWCASDEEESRFLAIDIDRLHTFVRYSFDGMTLLCRDIFLQQITYWRSVSDDPNRVITESDKTLAWRDIDTNLFWDAALVFQDSHGTMPIGVARYLNEVRYAGFSDWRQPTIYELSTLRTEVCNGDGFFIKSPLWRSHCHRAWGSSKHKGDDSLYFDYAKRNSVQQRYIEPDRGRGSYEVGGVASRSVRGEIAISEKSWVNNIARWAAKNNNYGFPVDELGIVELQELQLLPDTHLPIEDPPLDFLELKRVRFIKIGGDFQCVPNFVFRFEALEGLELCAYRISEIPPDIAELKALRVLKMHGRGVKRLPDSIVELQALKVLSLPLNTQCPLTESQMAWMETLRSRGCQVTQKYV